MEAEQHLHTHSISCICLLHIQISPFVQEYEMPILSVSPATTDLQAPTKKHAMAFGGLPCQVETGSPSIGLCGNAFAHIKTKKSSDCHL